MIFPLVSNGSPVAPEPPDSTANGHTATCAVFCADGDEGTVEARVVDHLSAVLGNRRKD